MEIFLQGDEAERAYECLEACEGIPDPAAAIQRAKAAIAAALDAHDNEVRHGGQVYTDRDSLAAALEGLGKEPR